MRIGGIQPRGLNECVLVLPRPEGDIVFRARAIPDYDEFEKLVPEPIAPMVLTKDGRQTDENDHEYVAAMLRREILRTSYFFIKSLEPSMIEWDTVVLDRPGTWANAKDDLRKAGFSIVEMNRIWGIVNEANCLSEDKLVAARDRFQRGQAQGQPTTSSPSIEPGNSPSGEPANASA